MKACDPSRPQMKEKTRMTQMIRYDVEDCSTEELQARLSSVLAELVRTQHAEGDRLTAQVEYQAITAAIARKRAAREDNEGCNQYL